MAAAHAAVGAIIGREFGGNLADVPARALTDALRAALAHGAPDFHKAQDWDGYRDAVARALRDAGAGA